MMKERSRNGCAFSFYWGQDLGQEHRLWVRPHTAARGLASVQICKYLYGTVCAEVRQIVPKQEHAQYRLCLKGRRLFFGWCSLRSKKCRMWNPPCKCGMRDVYCIRTQEIGSTDQIYFSFLKWKSAVETAVLFHFFGIYARQIAKRMSFSTRYCGRMAFVLENGAYAHRFLPYEWPFMKKRMPFVCRLHSLWQKIHRLWKSSWKGETRDVYFKRTLKIGNTDQYTFPS